jgi:hypothetical protein
MSYREFALADVEARLGLTLTIERLFPNIAAIAPRPEFLENLNQGVLVAKGVNSEKARSEFIIAPILLEFHRLRGGRTLFSPELNSTLMSAKVSTIIAIFASREAPGNISSRRP